MKLDLKKIKSTESEKDKTSYEEKDQSYEIHHTHELGKLFKKIRKKKGKTQSEIATFANTSRLAISEFENGKSDIKLSTLLKILKTCGIHFEIKEKK